MNKIIKGVKRLAKKRQQPESAPLTGNRITNETVAEHRERILAGGRKFKYPRQYAKHQLIRNTILILIIALVVLTALIWWQLYVVQNTNKFFYRLTQLVPLPVASVEGKQVRYSDYLRDLRGELHYLASEENVVFSSADGKRQLEYRKRASLDRVEENALINKLADQHNLSVSNEELDSFINQQISIGSSPISREQFIETVLPRYYDWSLGEYKDSIRPQLLKQKVAFAVDDKARLKAEAALAAAQQSTDFGAVVAQYSEDQQFKSVAGDVGYIDLKSPDPHGILAIAQKLAVGQVSSLIEGNNGYYIIKIAEINPSQVRYSQIFIGLTELQKQLASLHQPDSNVKEYIKIKRDSAATQQ